MPTDPEPEAVPEHSGEREEDRGAPTDPDPADEAAASAPGDAGGADAAVPGAGTAGAGGAKRTRGEED